MPEDKVRHGICARWINCSETSVDILVSCMLIKLVSTGAIYHVSASQAS